MRTLYVLISWGHKPSRTYIVSASTSREELFETIRNVYLENIYEEYHNEGYSDEKIQEMVRQLSYRELEDWMYENTTYVIESTMID